jgi:ribonuclease BN (tRNA processing enzyme)
MKIRVVGCGDAFGSGGRANTCFAVEASSGPFLIDCGASSLIKLKEYGIAPDSIGTILITHLHGDHFGGLVFLLREATLYKRRTKALTIAGPPGLQDRLNAAIEVFFPGGSTLPTTFDLRILELEPNRGASVDHLRVTPFPVIHPCGAVPYALRIEVDDKIIAYTADTVWVEALVDVGREADLFISEAYTYETPFGSHLDYLTLRRRLADIRPKRTILTHLSLDMLERLEQIDLEVARDGMVVEL